MPRDAITIPEWNDLTNEERAEIIAAVVGDGEWDGQIASDVYRAIRKVLSK